MFAQPLNMSLLNYQYCKINYSPKKLKTLVRYIKGNILGAILDLKNECKAPVRRSLTKFLINVYCDVVVKYPWTSVIEVVERYVGRCAIRRKRKFTGRGRMTFISQTRSNLFITLAIN
ncbi:MAG: hypothetical protein ACKER6_01530 [Candidatus Hodgkinia cicadicola]